MTGSRNWAGRRVRSRLHAPQHLHHRVALAKTVSFSKASHLSQDSRFIEGGTDAAGNGGGFQASMGWQIWIAINAVLNDLALRPAMTVFFNNHARAKAVRNAFQLMDMLSIDHK
jgi:hypothetical protein